MGRDLAGFVGGEADAGGEASMHHVDIRGGDAGFHHHLVDGHDIHDFVARTDDAADGVDLQVGNDAGERRGDDDAGHDVLGGGDALFQVG